jgi:hypothetical protein
MNQFRQMAVDLLKECPIKEGATDLIGQPITEKAFLDYFEWFYKRSYIENQVFEALKKAGLEPTATQTYVVLKALCKRNIKLDVAEYGQPATFRGSE